VERALDARLVDVGLARVRLRLRRDGEAAVDLASVPQAGEPVTLAVDESPVDSRSAWLYHKTSLREVYDIRACRHPGADDVVMVNERGELTETTRATLALRSDGRWWTPNLSSGCLPGVERGRLLEEGQLSERPLTLVDLWLADGLAVLSSLRGWRSAVLAQLGG
jgi:para-aminobenzoate synthetase / 4-amino-4-deoxychorismate lyase